MTVEEVERSLNHVASVCKFSSSSIRGRLLPRHGDAVAELVFQKVESIQAKRLVRLILKDFWPALIPEMTARREFHSVLPDCLMERNSLAHAFPRPSKC